MDVTIAHEATVIASRHEVSRKQVAAAIVGNALEVYDFITYAYFAVYIGQAFFPSESAMGSLLASLATFAVGFLTRPVGALLIGRLADRVGRKPAMMTSFFLMGVANLGMALTPSYAKIGIAGSIIIVLLRLLQGFALGGEVGPSAAYLFEAAPQSKRGLFVSFQYLGAGAAALAGGLVGYLLSNLMDADGLRDYGWRVAILIGAAIVPVGLVLRNSLSETLNVDEPDTSSAKGGNPGKSYLKASLLGLVVISAGATTAYVMSYLTTYSIVTLHFTPRAAFLGTVVSGIVSITMCPLGGWLTDRYGRKPVMLWSWSAMLASILPAFYIIEQVRAPIAVYGASIAIGSAGSIGATAVLVSVVESLPKHVRAGRLSLVYALAMSVFGGTAQFNVAYLTAVTKNIYAPAWYMAAFVVAGLAAMSRMRETAPARLEASIADGGFK